MNQATKEIKPGCAATFWYPTHADAAVHPPSWLTFMNGGALPTTNTDGDGLPDDVEQRAKPDPRTSDTDSDKVKDGQKLKIGSNPLVAESSFDVPRTLTGGGTSPSVRISQLRPEQVSTFTITKLSADQPQFPRATPGYVDSAYEFAVDGGFNQADIEVPISGSF